MKELTINQEAEIFQEIYKNHCPDYYSNFMNKKKNQIDDYEKYLNLADIVPEQLAFEQETTRFEENSFRSHCSSSIICDICGCSGHNYKHCKRIPTIEELESSINKDISYVEMQIKNISEKKKIAMSNPNQKDMKNIDMINSRIYAEDKFGLYVVDGGESDPIQIDGSLEDDSYCINCGKKGHIFSNCPEPNLTEILDQLCTTKNYNYNYNNFPMNVRSRFERIWNLSNNH